MSRNPISPLYFVFVGNGGGRPWRAEAPLKQTGLKVNSLPQGPAHGMPHALLNGPLDTACCVSPVHPHISISRSTPVVKGPADRYRVWPAGSWELLFPALSGSEPSSRLKRPLHGPPWHGPTKGTINFSFFYFPFFCSEKISNLKFLQRDEFQLLNKFQIWINFNIEQISKPRKFSVQFFFEQIWYLYKF
jgi:hypothetical protein